MNIFEYDVLQTIIFEAGATQRHIARKTGFSLGQVNKSLATLRAEGYVSDDYKLTKKVSSLLKSNKPKNAIILAAGYGMRMVPVNTVSSKGMITVHGERLVDRLIRQLHERNIFDIKIVVGFLKDDYEYLIDKYNVSLVYNGEYKTKNNLYSMKCVLNKIGNSYILPCDIYCAENIFSETEFYSWYAVTGLQDNSSDVRVSKKHLLEPCKKSVSGNFMTGISYVTSKDAAILKKNIAALCREKENDSVFWEKALFHFENIEVAAKIINQNTVTEINSYEQLRAFDSGSDNLNSEILNIVAASLNCTTDNIVNIKTLKKGMTNRSFVFEVNDSKYIMRIPGEGTDLLINRKNEANVYEAIKHHDLCDDLFYINADNGYKITRFVKNARVCDPRCESDLQKCMGKLRAFHQMNLQVAHEFDLFGQIEFYESLCKKQTALWQPTFGDYEITKQNVFCLKEFIDSTNPQKCLTHIDAVPDNFLISREGNVEKIQLIDWEYAGMQDPLVDLAMFCVYALYDKKSQIDRLIDIYFSDECSQINRVKIYCYISVCGLLWSNWCEYKKQLGVEFGEYSLRQYRFAKDYFVIARDEIKKLRGEM